MLNVYPDNFPAALWRPFTMEVGSGVVRTAFESGNTRQRRAYDHMPTLMNMQVTMSWELLAQWQPWMNQYAYEWIVMPARSMLNAGKDCAPHVVRVISDLRISSTSSNRHCTVEFVVEQDTQAEAIPGVTPQLGNWIVAGRPAAPAANIIVGGTP